MVGWTQGQGAMNQHLRKEIQIWEPQKMQMDQSSTYAAAYKAWPIVRNPPKIPKNERVIEDAPFDTRSTMQDSYQNWRGRHQSKSCKPTLTFESVNWMQPISTTHRDAFQQWPSVKQRNFKPAPKPLETGDAETGRSTMQDSYQMIRHFVPTKSCAPEERPLDKTLFDGTTTSRAAYLPWPVQAKYHHKRAEPQHDFSSANEAFPTSTYRDQFRELAIPKANSSALGIQVKSCARPSLQ
jgi:hypothetical protein